MANDVVKNPSHYCFSKYEPKDVIREWNLNFNLGNCIKYVARAGKKDDIIQDLKKARQYLDFEIEYLEQKRTEMASENANSLFDDYETWRKGIK